MTHTLSDLLLTAAQTHPDRLAVEDFEQGNGITYSQLESRTGDFRDKLTRHGVSTGDRVGIYAPKSVGTVTAIFGILAARAAYVPVDAGAPPQRNAGIFEDCCVKAIVVAKPLLAGLQAAIAQYPLRSLEELSDDLVLVSGIESQVAKDGQAVAVAEGGPSSDDLAYILYTSGSTGRPKGVIHTHASALSFIDWCSEVFNPTEQDRFSSHAPFHFDLSILDIYVPIKHGATLVLIGDDVGKQPVSLAPLIAARRISVWYSTPSILRLLAEYGKLEQYDWSALRLVLFAGEVFPVKHLRAIKRVWANPAYFNLYGPTETNVCTYYEVPSDIPDDRTQPFPIGYVCSGDRALLVDDDETEVAAGDEGELLISGGSVMQGYWNLPDRTSRSFFYDKLGTAWYRTGDVARWSAEDGFIFVGRRDRMVKRRGYRVELGEIEAALYRHPLVTEAAVTSTPDEENGVLIKAFLSLSTDSRPSLVEMKRFCTEQLPGYMIPDRFVFPGPLPKTSTDKVDYQRLRELA